MLGRTLPVIFPLCCVCPKLEMHHLSEFVSNDRALNTICHFSSIVFFCITVFPALLLRYRTLEKRRAELCQNGVE